MQQGDIRTADERLLEVNLTILSDTQAHTDIETYAWNSTGPATGSKSVGATGNNDSLLVYLHRKDWVGLELTRLY